MRKDGNTCFEFSITLGIVKYTIWYGVASLHLLEEYVDQDIQF